MFGAERKQVPIKAGVWSFKVTHPDFVDFYVSAYEIKVGQGVIKTSIMDRVPPVEPPVEA